MEIPANGAEVPRARLGLLRAPSAVQAGGGAERDVQTAERAPGRPRRTDRRREGTAADQWAPFRTARPPPGDRIAGTAAVLCFCSFSPGVLPLPITKNSPTNA